MNYLTADFGGTLVKYSVMDEQYETLFSSEKKAPVESVQAFTDFIRDALTETAEYNPQGIAVSMPGVIDSDHGFVKSAGAYRCMKGTDVRSLIQTVTDLPVYIENDGKCGALAEAELGNLKGCKNGIVIIFGTAVAGGIIIDGKLYKGAEYDAGEFSNIILDPGAGFAGGAAAMCSVAVLMMKASLAMETDPEHIPYAKLFAGMLGIDLSQYTPSKEQRFPEGVDGFSFFELLREDNQKIHEIYQEYLDSIVQLILNLRVILSPERILIGGGISNEPCFVSDIRKAYEEKTQQMCGIFDISTDIQKCRFGSRANQYGALAGLKNMMAV